MFCSFVFKICSCSKSRTIETLCKRKIQTCSISRLGHLVWYLILKHMANERGLIHIQSLLVASAGKSCFRSLPTFTLIWQAIVGIQAAVVNIKRTPAAVATVKGPALDIAAVCWPVSDLQIRWFMVLDILPNQHSRNLSTGQTVKETNRPGGSNGPFLALVPHREI